MKRLALAALLFSCAGVVSAHDNDGHDDRFHGHCSVSAVTLVFGPYDPFRGRHTDSTGNIAVSCAGKPGDKVAYSLSLSAGRSGTFAQRHMRAHMGHPLNYNLYVSASRTLVWGDGNNSTSVVTDVFTQTAGRATRNYPIYGRIFGGQNAYVGAYFDQIVVTLNF